jgi:hypothetical protein
MKIKFTNDRPHRSGLYLTPDGEILDIYYDKTYRDWWVVDFPRYRVTEPWNEKICRSTIMLEFEKDE